MNALFWLFRLCAPIASFGLIAVIAALLLFVLWRGAASFDLALFFGDAPPLEALFGEARVIDGLFPAIVGTLALVALTLAIAIFPAIATGIYLAEFASRKKAQIIGSIVDALSGVPSIVMGLFGFTMIVFLRHTIAPAANTSLLLSAFCLALLVFPALIVAVREALLSLPKELRLLCAAVGMPHERAVRSVFLRSALQGIMGGVILALGRAAEDTAVIMLTGVVMSAGLPNGLFAKYEALPFVIYAVSSEYKNEADLGYCFGASLVLLTLSSLLIVLARLTTTAYKRRFSGER
ncbi:phosphate ABC transporter permease [Campylobacterota bacterium]|nr:phosphate ABC transporter permease [Campylobacterota bacterium]